MLDYIQNFIAEIPSPDEKICFAMGYDSEMNGADTKNCHFSLFSTLERLKAWEAGAKQARLTKVSLLERSKSCRMKKIS